ncbi:DUF3558 domain-containing protein [Saccharothrix xinjiangensis]|uniref:DUF3558 domain-containing protein n=1 Tax=Saccharothrix xinjiangensis TaxID=204798 RepID=A0ABV9Y3Q3_9PSEU
MRRAVPLLAALVLLAGCSRITGGSATAGDREPEPTRTTGAGSSEPTSPSKAPVDRPKKIDVAAVDPCATLTEAQRALFGATGEPRPGTATTYQSPTCNFSREDHRWGFRVTTVTTTGISWYTDGSFAVEPEHLEVGGFPAVLGRAPGDDEVCFLGVDVADGQMVDVQVSSFEDVPADELCRLAPQIAGAVVETIANK